MLGCRSVEKIDRKLCLPQSRYIEAQAAFKNLQWRWWSTLDMLRSTPVHYSCMSNTVWWCSNKLLCHFLPLTRDNGEGTVLKHTHTQPPLLMRHIAKLAAALDWYTILGLKHQLVSVVADSETEGLGGQFSRANFKTKNSPPSQLRQHLQGVDPLHLSGYLNSVLPCTALGWGQLSGTLADHTQQHTSWFGKTTCPV